MAIFLCNVCGKKVVLENESKSCPECGSQGASAQYVRISDGVTRFTLKSGDCSYIVYQDKTELTRSVIKQFFSSLKDEAGNPIYMYCEPINPMMLFNKDSDGAFCVSAATGTANYFLLNGNRLSSSEQLIKTGDKLELFSQKSGNTVAVFEVS